MKEEDGRDMFKKAFKNVWISTIVVSPDSLYTPSNPSALKIRENTKDNPDNCEPAGQGGIQMECSSYKSCSPSTGRVMNNYMDKLRSVKVKVKVKWCHYRPGVAQRVGRGITLLFHNCGTRKGWVVSGTTRQHFTPGKDPVPIFQEAGWVPGPVWTGGKSPPHRDSISDHPAHS